MKQSEINEVNGSTLRHWDRTLQTQGGVAAVLCIAMKIVGKRQEAHVIQGPATMTRGEVVNLLRSLADTLEMGACQTKEVR